MRRHSFMRGPRNRKEGRRRRGGGQRGGDLRHWKWLELGIITLHSRQSAGRESEQRRIFRANCVSGRRRADQFVFCPVGDRFNWAKGDIRRCAWLRRTGGAGERPWWWWLRAAMWRGGEGERRLRGRSQVREGVESGCSSKQGALALIDGGRSLVGHLAPAGSGGS